ncbi:hypothetical protein RADP37_05564 [Roseomonas mucosa]|uniref:Uncharacterized protein n=1 Tax=Roseomonas mucosa TaxID=207340 RepID=A0A4Y1MUR0_9PROT|nr:hypothetical protein RADP37_05564 [Roseomonas mucosa]
MRRPPAPIRQDTACPDPARWFSLRPDRAREPRSPAGRGWHPREGGVFLLGSPAFPPVPWGSGRRLTASTGANESPGPGERLRSPAGEAEPFPRSQPHASRRD